MSSVALPPFIIEQRNSFYILRDDLLPGGTKRRALSLLPSSKDVFYAGTTMGHGALALAHACADNGKQAHIYIGCEDDHPMIAKLEKAGAAVHLYPPMPIANLHSLAVHDAKGSTVFPPGFDMPEFEEALRRSVTDLDVSPYSEIWTVSVTGVLTRSLKKAFPAKTFKTVSVVKSNDSCDFMAPEKYHQPAKNPPPYPACTYTDSKIWQFVLAHAAPNALIWNTAG